MKSYRFAVAFIMIFILIAHFVVGEPYLWYRNSISQLAGQAYPNAWIMRTGFIGFGGLVQIAGVGRMRAAGRYWYREVPILFYGLSILASGIFSTSSFIEGVPYSEREAQLYTLFAIAAGIALSAKNMWHERCEAKSESGYMMGLLGKQELDRAPAAHLVAVMSAGQPITERNERHEDE